MKTRHLAFLGLSLSAVVAVAANDAASGPKDRDDPPTPVEVLAHIPRLQYINSILVSPDGAAIATLRGENTSWNEGGEPLALQVWSVPGGDLLWTAKSPVFRLLTFSPDGKRLVGMTQDTRITIWDAANGRIRSRLSAECGVLAGWTMAGRIERHARWQGRSQALGRGIWRAETDRHGRGPGRQFGGVGISGCVLS